MKFVQFVGLGTLVHHPSRRDEWNLDRKLRAVKSAGFAGVSGRLDFAIASLVAKHELFALAQIFPDTPADFVSLLRAQRDFGVRDVSVELGNHEMPPAAAVKQWIQLEKTAAKLGLTVHLETHRDSSTETPEKVFELADRYASATKKTLRLAWDFSHLGVVKHLSAGKFVERLLARPDLIQNASFFHFRPFTRHHAQLPVTHRGKLTPEVVDYLDFAQEVMHIWKAAPANKDRTLFGSPSLGARGGYALTSYPPVWPDAKVLAEELNKRWSKAR